MSSHQVTKRGLPPSAKVCVNCPEHMYNYETLKETWVRTCYTNGRQFYERIKYYLNHTFDHHLKEIVFVVSYGADHNAGIFLDFKAYQFFKEKVQKAVGMGFEFPEVPPVKLSRKTPQMMRIFTSLKDFFRLCDQLRHKNLAIARQRYVNGVYMLERVNEVMEQKKPLFLAFNAEFSNSNPRKVQKIGSVVFSLENQRRFRRYHFFSKKKNSPSLNDITTGSHCGSDFPFEGIEFSVLADILCKLQKDISRVDFLVTISMSTESIRTFFRTQGLEVEHRETIDIFNLDAALFHESRKGNYLEEIMKSLAIPFEKHRLIDAGYNVIYITQILRTLLSQEFSII